jgi:CelD/BcsL family acetyltransferase involved in cellulose biosynthesis
MLISCISTLARFNELKSNWERVYNADSYASFFLSWTWIYSWFEIKPDSWLVLAIQTDKNSPYVSFFPFSVRTIQKYGLTIFSDLRMGGNFLADYTGFICLPGYEDLVIQHFAAYIKKNLKWDRFRMDDIQDPRLDLFLKHFSDREFHIQKNIGKASYRTQLSNDWNGYLKDKIGRNTRSSLRRAFKKIKNNDRFKITYLESNNLDDHLETIFTLIELKYGKKSERELAIYRHIFQNCFKDKSLWSCVVYDEQNPVSAFVGFIDRHKKTFFNYLMSYNPEYKNLGVGKAVCAYSIKYAIENNLETYDFGKGDFDFKHLLGGQKRFNTNVTLYRNNLRAKAFEMLKKIKSL